MRSERQEMWFEFGSINAQLPCPSRCFARNIVKWGNSNQIGLVVTCTADCTCHHPTILERNINFSVSREVRNKYGDLSIANVARLGSFKAFSFLSNEISIRGYLSLWREIYNHLIYFESMRSKPHEMVLEFDSITFQLPCLCRCFERNIVKWGTVTLLGSLKDFFRSWAKNIYTWLYVTLTGHGHVTDFEKNESMKSEPQEMVLVFDSITALLPCLSRCFERNIVKWGNSSQIDFVVTCTADCTCHHPRIIRQFAKEIELFW